MTLLLIKFNVLEILNVVNFFSNFCTIGKYSPIPPNLEFKFYNSNNNICKLRWNSYCHSVCLFSRQITYDDIQKTYGGGPTRAYYSGVYSSSTNAYMLMYRKIDPERNSLPMSLCDFPKHLQVRLPFSQSKNPKNESSTDVFIFTHHRIYWQNCVIMNTMIWKIASCCYKCTYWRYTALVRPKKQWQAQNYFVCTTRLGPS